MRLLAILPVLALLAACAQNAATTLPQSPAQSRLDRASGSSGDLLYVPLGFHLSIYRYPDLKRIKVVNTSPVVLGLWTDSDKNTGDMCFDNYSEVFVFKHGATQPYVTIPEPPSAESIDCALDSATNNLAITYSVGGGSNNNWVSVYRSPYDGSPTTYSDPGMGYMQFRRLRRQRRLIRRW